MTYSKELKVLDNQYYAEKDKPCPEVKEKIDEVINKLTKLIDRPDIIVVDVEKGEKQPTICWRNTAIYSATEFMQHSMK